MPIVIPHPVLRSAVEAFGLQDRPLRPLERGGAPDGAVYPCVHDDRDCFLKIRPMEPGRLPAEHERARFVEHLRGAGVTVPEPVASAAGDLLEVVTGDTPAEVFVVTLSVRLPGRHVRLPGDWNDDLIRAWGGVLGRMHAASTTFTGGHHLPTWDQECAYFRSRCRDDATAAVWDGLTDACRHLPTDPAGYGIVHNDLHLGNLLLGEDGSLSVLDFDVSARRWFAADIATALAAPLWSLRSAAPEQIPALVTTFLSAYLAEYPLDAAWSGHLATFVRYRLALLSLVMADELDGGEPEWLAGVRDWLLSGAPLGHPLPWPGR